MRRDIYRINVTNWKKYNGNRKKSYRCIMISERFLDDAKITTLTPCQRLLYLTCLLHSANSDLGIAELTPDIIQRSSGLRHTHIQTALDLMQSLQLLTYDKIDLLYKRKEKKGKERKGKEKNSSEVENRPSPAPILEPSIPLISETKKHKSNPESNRPTWESYRDSYKERYKVEPTRNMTVNSAIANFVKRVGEEDAPKIIEFFVRHNNNQYLASVHDVKLALRDAEGLRTQWLKGQAITMKDVRDFERQSSYQDQIDKINKGLI